MPEPTKYKMKPCFSPECWNFQEWTFEASVEDVKEKNRVLKIYPNSTRMSICFSCMYFVKKDWRGFGGRIRNE